MSLGKKKDSTCVSSGLNKCFPCNCDKPNIEVDHSRDSLISQSVRELYEHTYGYCNNYQHLFQKMYEIYCNNCKHAQNMYDYTSKLWFMPSTPVIRYVTGVDTSPISCFMNTCMPTTNNHIMTQVSDFVAQICGGGGVSVDLSYIPCIKNLGGLGNNVYGIINFIYMFESMHNLLKKKNNRTSAVCYYLRVNHPEIMDFIRFRMPDNSGIYRELSLNVHVAVIIDDAFLYAVKHDQDIELLDYDGIVIESVRARDIWKSIIKFRFETGEPFIYFKDNVEKHKAPVFKVLRIEVGTSNLCTEMLNPSTYDHLGVLRSGCCCLGSLNLAKWEEYVYMIDVVVEDCLIFLDNVLEVFVGIIRKMQVTSKDLNIMNTTLYSIQRTRSVGLGVCGLYDFLQQKGVIFDSEEALFWNRAIFTKMKKCADAASVLIGKARGACLDCLEAGMPDRFAIKIAIAPTVHLSRLLHTSPGIGPWLSNYYVLKSSDKYNIWFNPNLMKVLERIYPDAKQMEEIKKLIRENRGSVQFLRSSTHAQKFPINFFDLFRTAHEYDQFNLAKNHAERSSILSGEHTQSYNIYVGNMGMSDIFKLHMYVAKLGISTMYYCHNSSANISINNSSCVSCAS